MVDKKFQDRKKSKLHESGGAMYPEQKGFISTHRNNQGIPIVAAQSNNYFSEKNHAQNRQSNVKRRQRHELRSDQVTIDVDDHVEVVPQQSRLTAGAANDEPSKIKNVFYPSSQSIALDDSEVNGRPGSLLTSQDEHVMFLVANSEAEGCGVSKRNTIDSQAANQVSKIVAGPETSIDYEFLSQGDKSDILASLNQIKSQGQQLRVSNHQTQVSLTQNLSQPHQHRNLLNNNNSHLQPASISRSAIATPMDSVSQRDESQNKKKGKPVVARPEYTGLPNKQMKISGVRAQNLLARGHCSLSISSINSHGAKDDDNMEVTRPEPRNQADPQQQKKQQTTLTIDYDEAEFIQSTQEIREDKCVPYERTLTNRMRGLTPQRRLLSSQKLMDDSSVQASIIGGKNRVHQSEIKMHKVEQKRSVSVSAKESAAELQLPYNRRAMLLRERKEQLKQQARENSYQRSQQKNDSSVSRMIAETQSVATLSQQNFNLNRSGQQQAQMYTHSNNVNSGKLMTNSMVQYDPLNSSSFDHGQMLNNSNYMYSVDGALFHHQHPVIKHHTNQLPQPPGNHQMGQSMNYRPSNPVCDGESSEAQSRIERAKQMINSKFQQMVDWGNFATQLPQHQRDSVPDTSRTFGKQTQREINRNSAQRNVPVDLEQPQTTFGIERHNVFTPPAGKQFKLSVDEQGRIVPATDREGEGMIPHPNQSPKKLSVVQHSFSGMVSTKNTFDRNRALIPAISRNGVTTTQRKAGMTLNPNGQHGVVVVQDSCSNTSAMPGLKQETSNMYQRRLAAMSSAKSNKSLKDLLSVNKSMTRTSFNKRHELTKMQQGRPPLMNASIISGSEAIYSSVHQIRSPKMTASVFNGAHMTQTQMNAAVDQRLKQQEYPCSSFFQNEENFERSHRTETNGVKKPDSTTSSLKLLNQSSEPAFRGRSLLVQSANDSMNEQFITSIHQTGHIAGNVQGEEDGMIEPPKHQRSPQKTPASRNFLEKRLQQSSSKMQLQDKSTPVHLISLTARKNLSSQHNNMTPLLPNKLPNQHQRSSQKIVSSAAASAYHHQHMSPKFLVINGQQRENSAGRCSISSINFQQIGDDLPPDPSMQTRTIENENAAEDTASSKFDAQNKMLHLRQGDAPRQRKNNRHEIMAVAPKTNQISQVEHASSEISQSILITQSDVEGYRNGLDGASHFKSTQLATSMLSVKKAGMQDDLSCSVIKRPMPMQRSPPPMKPKTPANQSMTMVKVEEDEDAGGTGLSESEKKKRKRENSFIRDGYEIYVEGTYIVNGRKKKKIKKRKLTKAQLEQHVSKSNERANYARTSGNLSQQQQIEHEMKTFGDIGKQTLQMSTAKKMVTLRQSQISLKHHQSIPEGPQNLNLVKLMKQTASQPMIFSPSGKQSPRLFRPMTTVGPATKQAEAAKPQAVSNFSKQMPQAPRGVKEKRNLVTKVKVAGGDRQPKPIQQVPRSLFVKRSPRQDDTMTGNSLLLASASSIPLAEREEQKGSIESQLSNSSDTNNNNNHSNSQTLLQMASSQKSLHLRDPDLQLMTSNRMLTLHDVSNQILGGAHRFILHRMIFHKKFAELLKVFRSGFLTPGVLNERDNRGNTPLLLAAKLSANEEEYLRCINFLFKEGCDGKMRDGNGWSILDEAIGQVNPRLLAIAFQWLNHRKKEKIQTNKTKVLQRLQKIPDFYCELHWECASSWIPFLSKFAPSDDFQIWKVGSNIRLDFSLVGFKRMVNKRRRMSILFRNAAVNETDPRYKDIDILMVNRDRQILSNPLEDLDEDEKLAVLTDMMNSDSVQSELNIVDQRWEPVQNFFGTANAHETVNDYDCSRYKLQIEAQVRSKKKLNQRFEHTYESYFEGAEEFKEGQKAVTDPNSFKMSKDVKQTVESSLWLSKDFPLQFSQFMEVMDTLAISGQASMQKINEFLQNDCLKDVVKQNGFPVKIQVPIGTIVKANVTFGNFQYLKPENKEEYIKETFQIPDYCRQVSRKEAMKTMESKKKRLAVANVVI